MNDLLLDENNMCIEEYTNNEKNAEIYYKRAIGELPEMECSKAISSLISEFINENDHILDVGCACGHYLRSLKNKIKYKFKYTGIDPYEILLRKANIAWSNEVNVNFKIGNIYDLPMKDSSVDIIMCNNVFLHLPEIVKPLQELFRVSRKRIILRHLLYEKSYRIQLVYNNEWWPYTDVKPINEFDEEGNPISFSYFNIHSFSYFKSIINDLCPNSKINFIKDTEYKEENLNISATKEGFIEPTKVVHGNQISGCIVLPNYFVSIEF